MEVIVKMVLANTLVFVLKDFQAITVSDESSLVVTAHVKMAARALIATMVVLILVIVPACSQEFDVKKQVSPLYSKTRFNN